MRPRSLVVLTAAVLAGCAGQPLRWGNPNAAQWREVRNHALDARFIRATYPGFPSVGTQDDLAQRRDGPFVAWVRVCVARSGQLALVDVVRASGEPAIDRDAFVTARAWRFRPGVDDACTFVRFRYAPFYQRRSGPHEVLRR